MKKAFFVFLLLLLFLQFSFFPFLTGGGSANLLLGFLIGIFLLDTHWKNFGWLMLSIFLFNCFSGNIWLADGLFFLTIVSAAIFLRRYFIDRRITFLHLLGLLAILWIVITISGFLLERFFATSYQSLSFVSGESLTVTAWLKKGLVFVGTTAIIFEILAKVRLYWRQGEGDLKINT